MATPAAASSSSSTQSPHEIAILDVLRKHPEGITANHKDFLDLNIPLTDFAQVINKFSSQSLLKIEKDRSGNIVYKSTTDDEAEHLRGMNAEERIIYQLIAHTQDKGIWVKDLKSASNIPPMEIPKILKRMETRKIIKSVKSVQGARRKLYMLYDINPSRAVTGGPWFSGADFDVEFFTRVQETCFRAISSKGFLNLEDVASFVQNTGVLNAELSLDDYQDVINTLIYDGKVEEVKDGRPGVKKGSMLYRPTRLEMPMNGFTQIPCGRCPVFDMCGSEGEITPNNCVYYTKWLEF